MTPLCVKVPFVTSKVPPPAPSVVARAVVMAAVVRSVPPFRPSVPAAAPRLASEAIASVPPRICQLEMPVLLPARVQTDAPIFSKCSKPRYRPALPMPPVSVKAPVSPASAKVSSVP
ncbi:hypothetical protein D3C81_1430980 [compost metagenome]